MPIWAAVLVGLGAIVATIMTTPLWVYILKRPRVSFAETSVGLWAFASAEGKRYVYFGLEVEVLNEGGEDSAVIQAVLQLTPMLSKGSAFSSELVSDSLLGRTILKNGGRIIAHLLFRLPEPEPYRRSRKIEHGIRYFINSSNESGVLGLRPSQNRRLFRGREWIMDNRCVFESRSLTDKENWS